MKRKILIVLAVLIVALGGYLAYWVYDTYWKPEPPVVKEQDANINANITALMNGLPPAVPDLSNYPVSVENCGRTLTFAAPPKRVIGMWQPSNELLLALGVQDQMIGFAGMYDKLPAVFADAVRRVPKLGSIFTLNLPNKEEMIQAHPDLVVTEGLDSFAFDAAQGYATVQQVQAMGTQIYSSGSICDFKVASTRGLASVYQDLKALGQILGVSKRADEIVRRLQARENAVRQTVAPLKPVRVAFFNGDSEKIYVLNGAIWSDLMAKAGGINVFEDKKTNGVMSPEVFAGIDADVILYGIFPVNSVMPGRDPDKIKAYLTQTFPNIPAVKNGRLYPIQTINTESSVRAMDGLELIAKALHPEAFK